MAPPVIDLQSRERLGRVGGMTKYFSFRMFMGAVVMSALAACATHPMLLRPPLIGTWTNSLGTVWMIKADGTFDVDLNHHGQRDAWGRWSVTGDTVTLVRVGGIRPKGCDGEGVYHFMRSGDTLRFRLVSDACKLRRKNVLLAWHRR
ncbi:MAG TPA: hypothetical protein VFO30_03990 [Chthoniobacterales bacterium]|nr:hypothetical protein [Chthoniobacterales bacterium]